MRVSLRLPAPSPPCHLHRRLRRRIGDLPSRKETAIATAARGARRRLGSGRVGGGVGVAIPQLECPRPRLRPRSYGSGGGGLLHVACQHPEPPAAIIL